jgi:hypothetical protein
VTRAKKGNRRDSLISLRYRKSWGKDSVLSQLNVWKRKAKACMVLFRSVSSGWVLSVKAKGAERCRVLFGEFEYGHLSSSEVR